MDSISVGTDSSSQSIMNTLNRNKLILLLLFLFSGLFYLGSDIITSSLHYEAIREPDDSSNLAHVTPASKISTENYDSITDPKLRPPTQEWTHQQFDRAMSYAGFQPPRVTGWKDWTACGPKTYYFCNISTIFTGVPKTGCSNWVAALLGANGDLDGVILKSLSLVHKGLSNKYRMRSIRRRYNSSDLQDTFSFTVLRNPWTRLVSGYRDKLSDEVTQGASKRDIGIGIVAEMRSMDPEDVRTAKLYPTFKEYVQWLIEHKGNVNVHFHPQYTTLCMPHVNYDYILPLELSGPMSSTILRRVRSNNTSLAGSYDKASDPRNQSSTRYAREWLSKLSTRTVNKLYRIFKPDFMMMNYSNFTDPDFPLPIQS